MKVLIFLISYMVGFSSLLIHQNMMAMYCLLLGFYTLALSTIDTKNYKKTVVEPLVIAIFSMYIVKFLNGGNIMDYLLYLLIFPYLYFLLKGKEEKKGEDSYHLLTIVEKYLLPIMVPISLCFLITLIVKTNRIEAFIFLFSYYAVIHYFIQQIKTKKYGIVLCGIQSIMILFIFEHLSFLDLLNKILLIVFINMAIIIHIYRGRFQFFIHSKSI